MELAGMLTYLSTRLENNCDFNIQMLCVKIK